MAYSDMFRHSVMVYLEPCVIIAYSEPCDNSESWDI